ncbi:hypothetical protein F5Y19DRAFT_478553 [Xylariaceae sp. FL1651]|nr:hypothetical protein F5Y19DRAFT_478553 [Xylariaceae sp. FL1651]
MAAKARWSSLPPEVRLMILEIVVTHSRKYHQQSACAAVCREWQYFFEKHIFHRIILHQSDIHEFSQLFLPQQQRRWQVLKHIWLRIELPRYGRVEPFVDKTPVDFSQQQLKSLKYLSVFCESDLWNGNQTSSAGFMSTNTTSHMERLSVAFYVDARDFFQGSRAHSVLGSCRQNEKGANDKISWPNLVSLALTSALLRPHTPSSDIDDLLQAAANAAARMPNLEVLEIWNCDVDNTGFVFIFQYFRRAAAFGGLPLITSRSTWGYRLGSRVVDSWNVVANEHEGRDILLNKGIDLEKMQAMSLGSVMQCLELGRLVLQPVSACQFIWRDTIEV